MKAVVIGLGSMGKRRIRCLQAIGGVEIIGVDLREDRRLEAQTLYGIKVDVSLSRANDSKYFLYGRVKIQCRRRGCQNTFFVNFLNYFTQPIVNNTCFHKERYLF